jgi:hypothetical protein
MRQLASRNCGHFLEPGLCGPKQMALGVDGQLYVPDVYCRVRRLGADGAMVTYAGHERPSPEALLACGYEGENTPALQTSFDRIFGVAVSAEGDLYIADTTNSCVRKVARDGLATTFAGRCGERGFAGDGDAARQALLDLPRGVAVDRSGNVFVADSGNGRIRRVTPDGVITTVAGNGRALGD